MSSVSINYYKLAGRRQGFDLRGLIRTDCVDGYSEFRKKDGTCMAVILTSLVGATDE